MREEWTKMKFYYKHINGSELTKRENKQQKSRDHIALKAISNSEMKQKQYDIR